MLTHRLLCLVSLLASGCYSLHGSDQVADAGPRTLPEGVLFDHPEGRFTEVILTDAPIACDLIQYSAPDATGTLWDPSVPRWMSLVQHRSGEQRYFFHTETTNIGPGDATFSVATRGAIGEPVAVRWEADVLGYGRMNGTSHPIYCGVLTPGS